MTKLPKDWPVWWETNDGRPAGKHRAAVLDAQPYTGLYKDYYTHVLKLACPGTRKGYLEMAVDLRERAKED